MKIASGSCSLMLLTLPWLICMVATARKRSGGGRYLSMDTEHSNMIRKDTQIFRQANEMTGGGDGDGMDGGKMMHHDDGRDGGGGMMHHGKGSDNDEDDNSHMGERRHGRGCPHRMGSEASEYCGGGRGNGGEGRNRHRQHLTECDTMNETFSFLCGWYGGGNMPLYCGNMRNASGSDFWEWMPMFDDFGNESDWKDCWWPMPKGTNCNEWMQRNSMINDTNGTHGSRDGWYMSSHNNTKGYQNRWRWRYANGTTGGQRGCRTGCWDMEDRPDNSDRHAGYGRGGRYRKSGNSSLRCGGLAPDEHWRIMFLFNNIDSIRRVVTPVTDGIEGNTTSADPNVALVLQQHVADMSRNYFVRRWDPLFYGLYQQHSNIRLDATNMSNGVHVLHTGSTPCATDLVTEHSQAVNGFIKNAMPEMMETHPMPASCRDAISGPYADLNMTNSGRQDASGRTMSGSNAASSNHLPHIGLCFSFALVCVHLGSIFI